MLEIICGRKPIEDAVCEEEINLVRWVRFNCNNHLHLLDRFVLWERLKHHTLSLIPRPKVLNSQS